jgi:integrase
MEPGGMTVGDDLIDISISKYLYEDPDRHGNMRLYFRQRIPGSNRYRKVRLRETPGTPQFLEEFGAALAGRPYGDAKNRPVPPPKIVANSLRWLIQEYYKRSVTFKSYDEETKKVRRNLLKALCEEPVVEGSDQQVGDLPYNIPEDKIELLRDRKEGVYAANARLKAIRQLFKWAASTKPVKLLPRNHAADVPLLPEPETDGHHTWSVDEIQQYIARHPIGTKAHLVLMLFLLTGQRISDVAKLGKQHIRKPENVAPALRKDHPGRWLGFTQHKNRKKAPVHLVIPLLPLLERVLEASPCGSMTFIETEFGKPHSIKGLGNWFADQCVLAGVPGRAHGLRKAGATIAAENGATPYHLMSIFGWKTLEQAELYTKKVRQQLIAGGSMRLIDFDQIVNECDPPQAGMAKSGSLLG